jgi:hypothetical protein
MNQLKGTPVAPETMTLNGITFTATLKSTPKAWDGETTAPVAVNNADTIAQFVYDPSTGQVTKDNLCS